MAARAASAEPADPASGGACAADQQPPAAAGTQEAAAAARNDPLVEKIIALFDGALINVRKQK